MKTRENIRRSKQQEQSLRFFDEKAKEWEDKATGKIEHKVNVVKQRNEYVLHVIGQREKTEFVLDVGSGVGDLVCAIAKMGIQTTGIDIAGGMVDLAHQRAVEEKIELANFLTTDYFDWHVDESSYDLVAANGFVEYVSYQQRDNFFSDVYRILKPDGSLVVSSRNRLFNLVSANDYTTSEIELGELDKLVSETIALVNGVSRGELLGMETASLQPETMKHKHTGVGVETRYQYTPAQLAQLLYREGFTVINFSPIHVHVGPPRYKELFPANHFAVANKVQEEAIEQWSLIPRASAFMVHAKKLS